MTFTQAQENWLTILESGKEQQATGTLEINGRYCCLGLACKSLQLPFTADDGYFHESISHDEQMPGESYQLLGLHSAIGDLNGEFHLSDFTHRPQDSEIRIDCLASANDHSASFAQIAAFIRQYPDAVFVPRKHPLDPASVER